MNTIRTSLQALLGVAVLGLSGAAAAEPVYFSLSGPDSSVSISNLNLTTCVFSGCGVSADLNPGLGGLSNTLSAGQSWSFNFFSLDFDGIVAGTGSISASLAFDAPSGAPIATGSGQGSFWSGFIFSGWQSELDVAAEPGDAWEMGQVIL